MWSCHLCTLENDSSAKVCEGCNLPHKENSDTTYWQCELCCTLNEEGFYLCTVCNNNKGTKHKVYAAMEKQAVKNKERDSEPTEAVALSSSNSREAEIRTSEGWWLCQKSLKDAVCNTSNSAEGYRCTRCNGVKPYLPQQLMPSLSQLANSLASVRMNTADERSRTSGASESDDDTWRFPEPSTSTPGYRDKAPTWSPQPECQPLVMTSPPTTWGSQPECQPLVMTSPPTTRSSQPVCQPLLRSAPATQQDDEELEFPDEECRVVLVGKTGHGKSSLGNTLLGLNRFKCSPNFSSVTSKCQRHNDIRFGIRLEVLDTPGLFDTALDQNAIIREIIKCLGVLAPGPHAIILVFRIGMRFTQEENKAVEEIFRVFGVHLLRFLVIVFTHGDQLRGRNEAEKEKELKELLGDAPEQMKSLLDRANHRYLVFNNMADKPEKDRQVKQLLITIRNLMKVNGGGPMTTNIMRIVEGCMLSREEDLECELNGGRLVRKKGARDFKYRDMIRDEVVGENKLLDTLKIKVLPVIMTVLPKLLKVIVDIILPAAVKGCSLM